MNALTQASPTAALPALPFPLPDMTPALAHAVGRFVEPFFEGVDGRMLRPAPAITPAIIAEARDVLEAYARDAAPARLDVVRAWLMPLSASGRNALVSPGDFERLCGAVGAACDHLPWWVFNRQSLRVALGRFKFVPSPADVLEVLAECASEVIGSVAALRRIADTTIPDPPPPAPKMSPEERAAQSAVIRETVAAFTAETAARSSAPADQAPRAPRPAYLSPEMLAAARAAARKGA